MKMDTVKVGKLAVIWGKTHRNYRGKVDGKKAILVLRKDGTTLVPLTDLTDKEIAERMPKNVIVMGI